MEVKIYSQVGADPMKIKFFYKADVELKLKVQERVAFRVHNKDA